jgi:hypothetical protein
VRKLGAVELHAMKGIVYIAYTMKKKAEKE